MVDEMSQEIAIVGHKEEDIFDGVIDDLENGVLFAEIGDPGLLFGEDVDECLVVDDEGPGTNVEEELCEFADFLFDQLVFFLFSRILEPDQVFLGPLLQHGCLG